MWVRVVLAVVLTACSGGVPNGEALTAEYATKPLTDRADMETRLYNVCVADLDLPSQCSCVIEELKPGQTENDGFTDNHLASLLFSMGLAPSLPPITVDDLDNLIDFEVLDAALDRCSRH